MRGEYESGWNESICERECKKVRVGLATIVELAIELTQREAAKAVS